jgi:hypothetical protein
MVRVSSDASLIAEMPDQPAPPVGIMGRAVQLRNNPLDQL